MPNPASGLSVPVPPPALVVLAADASGEQIVSMHAKRAYRLSANGKCAPAEVPEPLLFAVEATEDDPGIPESDIIPFKESTDVIVIAEAYGGASTRQLDVRVQLGKTRRIYRVFGERRCIYRGRGSYTFSQPKTFERVPLCHALAYGGVDDAWPRPPQVRIEDALFLPEDAYPRNTVGLGYAIVESPARLDGLLLPQIENPEDLLTPERLVVGEPAQWWRQPFPWSCDWFDASWYPRYSFFGALPRGTPEVDGDMFEVRAGWVQAGQVQRFSQMSHDQRIDNRCADGAPPGLVLPFLRGDEQVLLEGVMPGGRSLTVQLPGASPRFTVRFKGKEHVVDARLNRVLISTRQMGVYLVWHAAFHPDCRLPLRHATRAEPSPADLEGVEAFVDGVRIASYDEWESQAAAAAAPEMLDEAGEPNAAGGVHRARLDPVS